MFSKASVKKPFTVIVAIVIVLILGIVSYTNMSIDLIPSFNMPYAIVYTTYPGASPEEVEKVVSSSVEQSMASLSNIEEISSTSSENMSIVVLKFNSETNMDSAMIEMRENLDMIKGMLPDGVGNSTIMKLNPNMMPIMAVAISVSDKEDFESSKFIDDEIIPKIESVSGVASTTSQGLIDNMVDITLNEEKINKFNSDLKASIEKTIRQKVTEGFEKNIAQQLAPQKEMLLKAGMSEKDAQVKVDDIKATTLKNSQATIDQMVEKQLAEMNFKDIDITKDMVSGILKGSNLNLPAGTMTDVEGQTLIVRVGNEFESIDNLKNLAIMSIENYGDVTLSDLADFTLYDNSSSLYSKVNGKHAVTLAVEKQPDFSTADVSHNILSKIDSIKSQYSDVRIDVLMDQGQYVDMMISSIVKNLIYGALLAILILYLFLRRIRPTLIVGFSIVISVITAFVLMYYSGISLNMISMGGLALGVGMLVDNSIVVMENISRMRAEGMSAKDSAINGAKEITGAITASTITTVIVFVPVTFTTGITRQLFTDMALTITYSLLASLLVALTLVPSFYSLFMKKTSAKDKKLKDKVTLFDKFANGYGNLLSKSLRHRWISLTLAVVLLATSIFVALKSGTQLFPTMDSGSITATVKMPDGYTDEEKYNALDQINSDFLTIEDIDTVGIIDNSGNGMMSMMSSGSSTVYVGLKEKRNQPTEKIIEQMRTLTDNKDYTVTISNSNMDMSMMTGDAVSIQIYGEKIDNLRDVAKQIGEIVENTEGTTEVDNGLSNPSKELRIDVDKDKAIAKGLTVAQVYAKVNEVLKAPKSTLNITDDDVTYAVYVKDNRDKEITENDVKDIEITGKDNEVVKVSEIANISYDEGLSSIKRQGQKRYITVKASLRDGYNSGDVNKAIEEKLNDMQLPADCSISYGGETEALQQTFSDLFLMLALAVVFIYLVMVAQFQSLLSPLIVMFTIPLAFTGGFLALFITGKPVSMVALIGMVILVGVVVNNGIVFVDYTNQLVQKGMRRDEALVKAGVTRLRPILMTALTTIIAMLVMAFDGASGGELMQPMCITTIGGLAYSTILTLFVVPAMYSLFHKDKFKLQSSENIEEEPKEQ